MSDTFSNDVQLSICAANGDIQGVIKALNDGAGIENRVGPYTALHQAILRNQLAVVALLVLKGASIESRTQEGNNSTSLMLAASNGYDEIVKFLIKQKAEIQAINRVHMTALHSAANSGHSGTVQLLLAHGANINDQTIKKNTPLHLAVRENRIDVVKTLLSENNIKLELKNEDEKTPLQLSQNGAITKLLLKKLEQQKKQEKQEKQKEIEQKGEVKYSIEEEHRPTRSRPQ